jgi:hypothetical protein
MKYEIPRRIVPAMLGVLLAIPGCTGSESGTGPERHTVQHEPTVLAHMSGYNSGSTIVVYGSDGAWSVDVQNGQLTLPSGRKIQMPANFASSVATTFQAIADDKASQLETQLSSSCVTDPYSQVCIANSRLPQPRRDPEGDLRPRKAAASTGVLVRRMPSGPEGSQSPRHSSPGTRAQGNTRLATTNVAYYTEPNCRSIATSIYYGTTVWRNTRSRVDEALHELYLELILEMGNPAWEDLLNREVIPEVVLATVLAYRAGQLEMALTEELHAHLELDYLAIAYNTLGCWNPSASSWPIWAGGGSSSRYICKEVWVQMSFDGGSSWNWFRAEECAYELVL